MQLEELRKWLVIEEGEDEDLPSLLLAAKSYIKNATGFNEKILEFIQDEEEKKEATELYNLAIKILVTHWNENRTPEIAGPNFHKLSFSLDTMLMQLEVEYLKYKYPQEVTI